MDEMPKDETPMHETPMGETLTGETSTGTTSRVNMHNAHGRIHVYKDHVTGQFF